MLAVFLVGAGTSLARQDLTTAGLGPEAFFIPVINGLMALVVFQFTVGNVWGYAVEYYNAGGHWTDLPFVTPFAVAILAALAVVSTTGNWALAAWAAFWLFIVVAGVVAVAVSFAAGYRDSQPT
jgi:hypothetical protein